MAYDSELFLRLFEIFPGSFDEEKTATIYDSKPGPFGPERVEKSTERITLADRILDTAKAISREGRDMDRAFRYLDMFRMPKVQRQTIKEFRTK